RFGTANSIQTKIKTKTADGANAGDSLRSRSGGEMTMPTQPAASSSSPLPRSPSPASACASIDFDLNAEDEAEWQNLPAADSVEFLPSVINSLSFSSLSNLSASDL